MVLMEEGEINDHEALKSKAEYIFLKLSLDMKGNLEG